MESTYTHAPEIVSRYSEDNILFCEVLRLAISDTCSKQSIGANSAINVDAIHWLESNDSDYFFHMCNVDKPTALNEIRKGYRVGKHSVKSVQVNSAAFDSSSLEVVAIYYTGKDIAQVIINDSNLVELMPIGEGEPTFVCGKLEVNSIRTDSSELFALVKVK